MKKSPLKTTPATGKLVKITWMDHTTLSGGWNSEVVVAANATPSIIVSIGWIVKEMPKYITLASTWSQDNMLQGEICILKNCIVTRKNING